MGKDWTYTTMHLRSLIRNAQLMNNVEEERRWQKKLDARLAQDNTSGDIS